MKLDTQYREIIQFLRRTIVNLTSSFFLFIYFYFLFFLSRFATYSIAQALLFLK